MVSTLLTIAIPRHLIPSLEFCNVALCLAFGNLLLFPESEAFGGFEDMATNARDTRRWRILQDTYTVARAQSTPLVSQDLDPTPHYPPGKGKRVMNKKETEEEEKKPKEVVHVRARRGNGNDSDALYETVRNYIHKGKLAVVLEIYETNSLIPLNAATHLQVWYLNATATFVGVGKSNSDTPSEKLTALLTLWPLWPTQFT
ncbi:hypothetical protein V2J09_010819 [Rumex salicifolius]